MLSTKSFASTMDFSITSKTIESITTSQLPVTTAPSILPSTTQEAQTPGQVPLIVNVPGSSNNSEDQNFAQLNVEPVASTKLDVSYEYDDDYVEEKLDTDEITRKRRAAEESEVVWGKLIPGACVKGCAFGFYAFSIVSSIVNCLGSSGRIGNLLVNYRCVSKQDKSVTQGLILMLISLFALIPGPIMFGRIIDATCLVWTEQCSGRRGNCQLYDQRKFRYYINGTAFFLTGIGVFFDFLVWKFGKNLDLYGEREEEMLQKQQKDARNVRNGHNWKKFRDGTRDKTKAEQILIFLLFLFCS